MSPRRSGVAAAAGWWTLLAWPSGADGAWGCATRAPAALCDERATALVARADAHSISDAVISNAASVGLPDVPLVGELPNPLDAVGAAAGLVGDGVKKVAGGVTGGIFDSVADGVADGAAWLLGQIAGLIDATTRPDVQAAWFTAQLASVGRIAALVAVPLLIVAAVSAVRHRDAGTLVTSVLVVLPMAMVLTAASAALVALLIGATDELTRVAAADAGASTKQWFEEIARPLGPSSLPAPSGVGAPAVIPAMLRALVGLLLVLGSVAVWIELTLRSAAIYLTVACLPLAYVAMLYPRWVQAGRRAVEVVLALIFSKFFIVLALSVGARALGEGDGFNALMAGLAVLVLTAFVPAAIFMLLPQLGQAMQQAGTQRSHLRSLPGVGMAQQAAGSMMLDRLRNPGAAGHGPGTAAGNPGPSDIASRVAQTPDLSADQRPAPPSGAARTPPGSQTAGARVAATDPTLAAAVPATSARDGVASVGPAAGAGESSGALGAGSSPPTPDWRAPAPGQPDHAAPGPPPPDPTSSNGHAAAARAPAVVSSSAPAGQPDGAPPAAAVVTGTAAPAPSVSARPTDPVPAPTAGDASVGAQAPNTPPALPGSGPRAAGDAFAQREEQQ